MNTAGKSADVRLGRLYQSDKGIWHYEFERNGVVRWSSLRTRNERDARTNYERIRQRLASPDRTRHADDAR